MTRHFLKQVWWFLITYKGFKYYLDKAIAIQQVMGSSPAMFICKISKSTKNKTDGKNLSTNLQASH